jgi:hypothetical protein
MLKKILAFSLAVLMILGTFTACDKATPDETEPTMPTKVDDGVIDVLMVGNSFCYY